MNYRDRLGLDRVAQQLELRYLVRPVINTMLKQHFKNEEDALFANAKKAGIFSHPNNIGQAREVFVNNFLQNNLPAKLTLWNGEIVDYKTTPKTQGRRNQIDIGVVREDMSVISPDGKTAMIPYEAVLATIEVKSVLTEKHLLPALNAIQNLRKLKRAPRKFVANFGYVPPRIVNFIFAYDGPKSSTAIKYLKKYKMDNEISDANLFDVLTVIKKYTFIATQAADKKKKCNVDYYLFQHNNDNLFVFMKFLYFSSSGFLSMPPSIQPYFQNRSLKGNIKEIKI